MFKNIGRVTGNITPIAMTDTTTTMVYESRRALAGSTEGAHRACVLLGIIATCRAVGVPAQAYLAWAFDRLGTHRDVFGLKLEDMTPAAFKNTLG